jgi:hypothetical protein
MVVLVGRAAVPVSRSERLRRADDRDGVRAQPLVGVDE